MNNLDQGVSEQAKASDKNADYAARFSKVLANAKSGGADNQQVFDFLSSPIETKVSESSVQAVKGLSVLSYYVTVLMTVAAISFTLLMRRYVPQGASAGADKVDLLSQKGWRVRPQALAEQGGILAVATVFTGLTVTLAFPTAPVAAGVFTFMSMVVLMEGLVWGFRRHRLGISIILGFAIGLYLLLTPILGVSVEKGGLLSLLFRLSPLQNMENGFSILQIGGSIGAISLIVLFLLCILGLGLNVYENVKEDEDEWDV